MSLVFLVPVGIRPGLQYKFYLGDQVDILSIVVTLLPFSISNYTVLNSDVTVLDLDVTVLNFRRYRSQI